MLRSSTARPSKIQLEGAGLGFGVIGLVFVAEWIHFTLVGIILGIILPTIKRKVYTFWGL